MPQTVQILRTASNNPPGPLLAGELSTELGGQTKLWVGATGGNRLLISTDPADTNAAAGSNYLPLRGGALSGGLSFGSAEAAGASDLTRHITLHTGGYGFNVTTARMNYNVPVSAQHVFAVGVAAILSLNGGAANVSPVLNINGGGTVPANQHLSLVEPPTATTHAANKAYVDAGDAANAAELTGYLPLIGGDMVGAINLPLAPTTDAAATNKAYVDLQDSILQEQIDLLTDNLVFAGQIDASIDNGTYTAASGIPDGPLPEPVASLKGFYVIVNTGGQPPLGNIPPGTYARGDWIICDGTVWVELHLGLTSVIAPEVALSPSIPNLGANVQTGLTYLQANYLPRSGGAAFAMTGGLNFGNTYAPGGPTDLSRHISLYQPGGLSTGISATSGRMNYVSPGTHVFILQTTEVMLIGGTTTVNVPFVANSTVTLSADPLLNLQAATKQYVDAAVAGSISAVVTDGVSIVGDGTDNFPLECFTLDAGTY